MPSSVPFGTRKVNAQILRVAQTSLPSERSLERSLLTSRASLPGAHMRDAGETTTLAQQVEQSLRELGHERELIRLHLQTTGAAPQRWAELEHRACIAALVGRKATPAARKNVEGALAAVRAFRATLLVH